MLCRETFPLLMDPGSYSPDTLDIWSNRPEMDYWLGILGEQVDNIVEKAIASECNSPGEHQSYKTMLPAGKPCKTRQRSLSKTDRPLNGCACRGAPFVLSQCHANSNFKRARVI